MDKSRCNMKFDRHTYTFVNLLDYFRSKELYCDATIACDGKKYLVHQVVLSACSDFFANIFASTTCQNPVVVLQDVRRAHLESLLIYIYRGEVHVPQYELPNFVKVAKSLFIKGLMIPHLEKYQSPESINGTWHDPYYGTEEETVRLQAADPRRVDTSGHVPMVPRVRQHRGEVPPRLPSYQYHMQLNSNRVDDHPHKRQRVMDPAQYARHDGRPQPHHHKRPHHVMEHPQDHRIPELPHQRNNDLPHQRNNDLPHQRNNASNNDDKHLVNSQTKYEDKEPSRCDRDVSQKDRRRSRSSEGKEQREDKRSKTTSYDHSSSHGTFQKLVVADEIPIKEEPIDLVSDCDTKPLDPLEEEVEDSRDYEGEEAPLQISEDLNDMPNASSMDPRSNEHSELNNDSTEYSSNSEHMSRSSDPSASPLQHLNQASQLRIELLRPVLSSVGNHHHPQQQHQRPHTAPQSIPHPVIAPREALQSQIKSQPQHSQSQHLLRDPQSQHLLRDPQSQLPLRSLQLQHPLRDTQAQHQLRDSQAQHQLRDPQSQHPLRSLQQHPLRDSQSQHPVRDSQSHHPLRSLQSQHPLRSLQSQHPLRDSQSQQPFRDHQSQHPLRDPQSQHLLRDSQSQNLIRDSQSQHLLRDSQSQHPLRDPQSQHPLRDSQSQNLLRDPQLQHPLRDPQSQHPLIDAQSQHPLRDPQSQYPLREPPPLMKIPTSPEMSSMIDDSEGIQPHCSVIKDLPVSRSNSHLLVSAPPTYRSHNSTSNHLCFEIHNQQLGQVIVNGVPHIDLSTPSCSHQKQSQPQNNNCNNNNNKNNNNNNNNNNDDNNSNQGPSNVSGTQRNSPEISEEGNNEDPFLGKIVTNRKKRLRGPKSWEFLVRLMKDPTTNPGLIRWEHEKNGVFRLVQPSVIAQRWGRRTGKHASECLTYDNFARGLRYHYATGALHPVSEKNFVYRFGPKALKLLRECDSSTSSYI